MSFRDEFLNLLKEQKAPGRNYTKSFTFNQIRELFDEVWQTKSYFKGCAEHGECLPCEVEHLYDTTRELQKRVESLESQMDGTKRRMDRIEGEMRDGYRGTVRRDVGGGSEGVGGPPGQS